MAAPNPIPPGIISLPKEALWRIMSYSMEWNLPIAGVNEDVEIDVQQIVGLRFVCKTFRECFEDNQGLACLKTALTKERKWKSTQRDNLEYALGCYYGGKDVGMLLFDSREAAHEFCRDLVRRINEMEVRRGRINGYLGHAAMATIESSEPINERPIWYNGVPLNH
jgi:hypothetical protein